MCGRYTQTAATEALRKRFRFEPPPYELLPRYNVAPTQDAPVVTLREGKRRLELFQWGLIPSWAKDPKVGARQINARCETAAEKPSFRRSFAKRRCLVLADGFYEWKPVAPTLKWPMRVVLPSREPFALAGLWDEWRTPEGKTLRTFTILTTGAPPELLALHDRVPVILPPEGEERWLDEEAKPAEVMTLLSPPARGTLLAYPVSPLVNSAKADVPDCIKEAEIPSASPGQPPLF